MRLPVDSTVLFAFSNKLSCLARACSTYQAHTYITLAWIMITCKNRIACREKRLLCLFDLQVAA